MTKITARANHTDLGYSASLEEDMSDNSHATYASLSPSSTQQADSTHNTDESDTQQPTHPFKKLATNFAPWALFTMMFLAILSTTLLALLSQTTASAISIPGPDSAHEYKVSVAHFPLTDSSRKDPFAPSEHRKIMLSLFMPVRKEACSQECAVRYMPEHTAEVCNAQFLSGVEGGGFEGLEYMVCCASNVSIDAASLPVVLFEPQTDTSRLMYANMARFISANGVATILIDHPHDSSIVEFPDEEVVLNNGSTQLSTFSSLTAWNDTITSALAIREADIHFALSTLQNQTLISQHFPNLTFTSALSPSSPALIGHGLGGTVATSLSLSPKPSTNYPFSISLLSTPPLLTHTTRSRTYLLSTPLHRRETDIHWPLTWRYLTGPATELDIANAQTMDFTDLPVIVELAQNEGRQPSVKGKGAAGGAGANHAVTCVLEGIVRDRLKGETRGVSGCVDMFGEVRPYMAAFGGETDEVWGVGSAAKGRAVVMGMLGWGVWVVMWMGMGML